MKYQMLAFAVAASLMIGEPVSALTDPPAEPTYSRPGFDNGTPPGTPPSDPPQPPAGPEKRKVWDLVCSFEKGSWEGKYNPLVLTRMYAKRVDPALYPLGSHFCKGLHPHRNMSVLCEVNDGKTQVTASGKVSIHEHARARHFCDGVLSK